MVGSKIELPIQHKFLWGKNWKRRATVSSYLWWSDLIGSGQPKYISISPLIDYFAHHITETRDTNSPCIKMGATRFRIQKIKGLHFQDGLHGKIVNNRSNWEIQFLLLENCVWQTDYFSSLYLSQAIEPGEWKEIKLRRKKNLFQVKLRKQFLPMK